MCKAQLTAFTQKERENAAKTNYQAVEELIASKGFIEAGNNSIPRKASEEGLPLRGSDESMP